jgi:hypothetical protein
MHDEASLFAELRGLLCPGCGPGDRAGILAAAVDAVKRRVVVDIRDGDYRARFQGGSVDEVNRLMGHAPADAPAVVTFTEHADMAGLLASVRHWLTARWPWYRRRRERATNAAFVAYAADVSRMPEITHRDQ